MTIRKLLTLHVRTARFVKGHLEQVYEKGYLTTQRDWLLHSLEGRRTPSAE
jgi:hypothetical protein